jgi:SAM-dependent methyltransferase
MLTTIERLVRQFVKNGVYALKAMEYDFVLLHVSPGDRVLDVGCGVGLLMERLPKQIEGLDVNANTIEYCRNRGLTATVGSALDLPFGDQTFDVVHCSQVMHIFNTNEAYKMLKEFVRVTKLGGRIVISTKPDHPHFWQNPENARPYPPAVFYIWTSSQASGQNPTLNPMWEDLFPLDVIALNYRRPPLFYCQFSRSLFARRVGGFLNVLQSRFLLKKYWTFDSYSIVMKKRNLAL